MTAGKVEAVVPSLDVPAWIRASLGRLDQRIVTGALIVVAVVLAWICRWTQDDAYISLRYAQNLADGHGLVFNVGEPVEGYTNFLWTVLLAIPFALGWDPVQFGHVVGVALLAVSMLLVVRVAVAALGTHLHANLALIALMLGVTFIGYGTGGLETQLQAALVTGVLAIVVPALCRDGRLTTAQLVASSALSGIAVMVRMDSAVVLAVALLAAALPELRAARSGDEPLSAAVRAISALVLPALALLVPWLLWRHATYGEWLPNTAVAKRPGSVALLRGTIYLTLFGILTMLVAFVPVAVLRGRQLVRRRPFALFATILVIWVAYVWFVGADFMEFRFMVVVFPVIATVEVALLTQVRSRRWQFAIVGALVLSVPLHLAFPGGANVDSIRGLGHLEEGEVGSWSDLGQRLKSALGATGDMGPDEPVIALTPAGVIPFESRLRTVDMLGLNDPWTARNGAEVPAEVVPKAGHERIAPVQHLLDSGANLVIGHPRVQAPLPDGQTYGIDDLDAMFLHEIPDPENIPDSATMVEMPLPDGRVLRMLYLTPDPTVDALIADGTWRQVPIDLDR